MKFYKLKQKWEKDRLARFKEAGQRKTSLKKATPIFVKYNISRVVLFGSVAENRCTPESDIDLYVHPLHGKTYWEFRRELNETLGTPVDIYTDTDDIVFVKKILERGQVIYEI